MRSRRNAGPLLASAVALALLLGPTSATLAFFSFSRPVDANVLTAQRVFSGQRVNTAFHVFDASAGGSASDQTLEAAYDDGRQRTTGAWSTAFSSTRYLEYDLESPVPTGVTITAATFDFKFASTGAGTGCYYFETRTASTGALLNTYGSSGSPIGCVTGTTQTASSTSIVSSMASSATANDLRIRVYGRESNSVGWKVELATVSVTADVGTFTLYRSKLTDQATGSASTDTWGLVAAADSAAYTSQSAWTTSFSSTRYVEFRFPNFVPSGSVISAAELRHTYKPASSGYQTIAYVNHATAANSSNSTSITISVPSGISNGNVLVAGVAVGGNSTFSVPSGWTQIYLDQNTGGSAGLWYRVASSEPASYNWGFGSGNSRKSSGFIAAYSGVDTSSPVDASSGSTVSGSGTSVTAPTITTTVATDMLLMFAGAGNGITYTAPGTMSERLDLVGASGGSGSSVMLDEQTLSSAGATGTRVATASGNPNRYSAVNVALKPASLAPNDCYYFEVYDTTTLLATHGSSGSPVSCNTSTSSYAADTVSLTEINSAATADDIRIRMYFKDAVATQTMFDRVRVAVTYSTP